MVVLACDRDTFNTEYRPEHQQVLKSKSAQPGMLFELDAVKVLFSSETFSHLRMILRSVVDTVQITPFSVTQSMLSKVLEAIRMILS